MRLADFPAGETIFLDANCVIYHFTGTYPSCALLLERAGRGEIAAVTSAAVLAEVHHRLMVAEAIQRSERPLRNVPRFLKRHPERVRQLHRCQEAFSQLRTFRIRVLPVTRRLVWDGERLSHELGLLTTDAIIVATMRAHHVVHLASHDADFLRIHEITVWRP